MSNLRNPKVFVYDPGTQPMIVTNTKKPHQLLKGEVGIFRGDTLVGAGATPAPGSVPNIQIHQNVGDSAFGTVRTKIISSQKVIRWYGQRAAAPTAQISYIGYDEVDATKDINIKKGQDVTLTVLLYDRILTRYYGPGPYKKYIPIEVSLCAVCVADCTKLDGQAIANLIANTINGVTPVGEYPEGSELKSYMNASVVTTGTGDAAVWGVKVQGTVPSEKLLNSCDPKDFYEVYTPTFTFSMNSECVNVPITKTASATPGCGFAGEVANAERESQGYDRVRDQFEHPEWMLNNNFIINAKNGTKYDMYQIDFDWTHTSKGVQGDNITEPYSVIIYVPTTSGAEVEAAFNAWLTPLGFTAVNIDSGTVTGSTDLIRNA